MGISASVTNNQITATVGETQIDVAVSGGVGPTGSSGTVAVSAPITNAGTTTAANIGLSVGTGLAVSGGSLVVSYGTSSTVACRGDDARLSDSREWSADTVSQAEAEAGSSTTRRAFTPQRVFQAIAAWWAASASKTKLDGIAAGATANATDAQLRDRSTHTGTQLAATISDFTTAVIAAAPPTTNASLLTSGTLADARLSANVVLTNDARLSDARTPTSHAHGNITNAGAIGSTSGQIVVTTTSGVLTTAASLGWSLISSTPTTLAGYGITDAVASSDSRLTDARTPTAHKTSHATGGTDALTPADIGAAALTHAHSALDVTSGTFDIARLPVGTTSTTVAAGDHTHTQLHDRSHAITSSSDHTATAWRAFYSNGSGVITELALGAANTVLTSNGASAAPTFSALPAGGTKTIIRFHPGDNQPPATNFATLDTRNSFLVLEFDSATQESANFIGVIPEGATLTNGLTVRIWWMGDTATSGNVRWGVSFEKVGTDNDADSFSSVTEATGAANGTSGVETVTSITATNIDSLVAGDRFRLRVARIAADATNDTMTGDAQLVAVEVQVA